MHISVDTTNFQRWRQLKQMAVRIAYQLYTRTTVQVGTQSDLISQQNGFHVFAFVRFRCVFWIEIWGGQLFQVFYLLEHMFKERYTTCFQWIQTGILNFVTALYTLLQTASFQVAGIVLFSHFGMHWQRFAPPCPPFFQLKSTGLSNWHLVHSWQHALQALAADGGVYTLCWVAFRTHQRWPASRTTWTDWWRVLTVSLNSPGPRCTRCLTTPRRNWWNSGNRTKVSLLSVFEAKMPQKKRTCLQNTKIKLVWDARVAQARLLSFVWVHMYTDEILCFTSNDTISEQKKTKQMEHCCALNGSKLPKMRSLLLRFSKQNFRQPSNCSANDQGQGWHKDGEARNHPWHVCPDGRQETDGWWLNSPENEIETDVLFWWTHATFEKLEFSKTDLCSWLSERRH